MGYCRSSEPRVAGSNPAGRAGFTSNGRLGCTQVHVTRHSSSWCRHPFGQGLLAAPPHLCERGRRHNAFGWSPEMHDASCDRLPAEVPRPHGADPRMIAEGRGPTHIWSAARFVRRPAPPRSGQPCQSAIPPSQPPPRVQHPEHLGKMSADHVLTVRTACENGTR